MPSQPARPASAAARVNSPVASAQADPAPSAAHATSSRPQSAHPGTSTSLHADSASSRKARSTSPKQASSRSRPSTPISPLCLRSSPQLHEKLQLYRESPEALAALHKRIKAADKEKGPRAERDFIEEHVAWVTSSGATSPSNCRVTSGPNSPTTASTSFGLSPHGGPFTGSSSSRPGSATARSRPASAASGRASAAAATAGAARGGAAAGMLTQGAVYEMERGAMEAGGLGASSRGLGPEHSWASSAFTQRSGATDKSLERKALERKARAAEAASRRQRLESEAEAQLAASLTSNRHQRLVAERQTAQQQQEHRARQERLSGIVMLAAKAWVLWAAIEEDRAGRALRFRRKAAAVLIAARYKAMLLRRQREQMADKSTKLLRALKPRLHTLVLRARQRCANRCLHFLMASEDSSALHAGMVRFRQRMVALQRRWRAIAAMRAAQAEVLAMALQSYEQEVLRQNTGCGSSGSSSSASGIRAPAVSGIGSGGSSSGIKPAPAGQTQRKSAIEQQQQQQQQEDPAVMAKLARLKEPLPKAIRCKLAAKDMEKERERVRSAMPAYERERAVWLLGQPLEQVRARLLQDQGIIVPASRGPQPPRVRALRTRPELAAMLARGMGMAAAAQRQQAAAAKGGEQGAGAEVGGGEKESAGASSSGVSGGAVRGRGGGQRPAGPTRR